MMKRLLLNVLCLIKLLGVSAKTLPQNNNGESLVTSPRIIGGYNANIRGNPFIAAVRVQTSNSKYFCGGALFGSQWVLTAGQCVDNAVLFTINFGSATLEDDDANRVSVATSDYILHPEYNPLTLENDIGLIKLRMPINHTDYIKSIDQLPTSEVLMDTPVSALGWGQTNDHDASLSNKLQIGYFVTLTNDDCKKTYGNQITDNMVCIAADYNEGICHGDTGGPLIQSQELGLKILVGIASFLSSNGCGSTDPSGFTRLYPYVNWITNVTNL